MLHCVAWCCIVPVSCVSCISFLLQDQLEPGSSILMHHKNLSSLASWVLKNTGFTTVAATFACLSLCLSLSCLLLYSFPGTYPIYPQQVEQRCQSLVSTKIQSGQRHRGVIGLLVDEVNPLVSVMKVDKAQRAAPNCALGASDLCCTSEHQWNQLSFAVLQAPTESYADIGGLEDQIMEMKEATEWQRSGK